MKKFQILFLLLITTMLASCGFHLRGQIPLSPALQNLYIKTKTPYSDLTHNLKSYLIMSHVNLTDTPELATTVLQILSETSAQQLSGVSPTQQTRQYNLTLTVIFQITKPDGTILVPPQTSVETRSLSVSSSQVLAGSNQATTLVQDMRRAIVFDIMNVLSSRMITLQLNNVKVTQ